MASSAIPKQYRIVTIPNDVSSKYDDVIKKFSDEIAESLPFSSALDAANSITESQKKLAEMIGQSIYVIAVHENDIKPIEAVLRDTSPTITALTHSSSSSFSSVRSEPYDVLAERTHIKANYSDFMNKGKKTTSTSATPWCDLTQRQQESFKNAIPQDALTNVPDPQIHYNAI